MARDQDPKTARLYDRRTVERNIKKGLITRKDWDKHLKSLDDVADKGVYGTEADDVDDDIDDTVDEAETVEETSTEPESGAPSN